MSNSVNIPTWTCTACGYKQDFDPAQPELHDLHHPDVPFGLCPSCGTTGTLTPELRPEEQTTVTVLDHAEVDALTRPDGMPLADDHRAALHAQVDADRAKHGIA